MVTKQATGKANLFTKEEPRHGANQCANRTRMAPNARVEAWVRSENERNTSWQSILAAAQSQG